MTASTSFRDAIAKVDALMSPRNVVVVGATDRAGNWSGSIARNIRRHGYEGGLFYLNPGRTELWGEPCYRSFEELPERPDHLVVLVPAAMVADALERGASAGARSATVLSTGFGEGVEGREDALTRGLIATIERTGMAVCGPNCFGNIVGKSRLVTMPTPAPRIGPGHVALLGQSGGVLLYMNEVLYERGIEAGYAISSGNELGLDSADYIAYLAEDPAVELIICYSEAIARPQRFAEACKLARDAGKRVIVIKAGQSEAGKAAALAHTGSLAGSTAAFDAVAAEWGVIRTDNLDEAVELAELLLHARPPRGRRLGAVTLSGAFCGFLLDAAEKNGLHFPPLAEQTRAALQKLGPGAAIANPLDGGGIAVLASADTYLAAVAALEADPNVDMVLVQDETGRRLDADLGRETRPRLQELARRSSKPIACVAMLSHSHSEISRQLKATAPNVAFLSSPDRAMTAIRQAVRSVELAALSSGEAAGLATAKAGRERALNEVESKALLASFGIKGPAEERVASADEAVAAAGRIGYPVALKVIAAAITHKSDVGGVALDLRTPDELRNAHRAMVKAVASHGHGGDIEGFLVSQYVTGGVELVLGVHRDPEVGAVIMAGAGGVLLEIMRDVAFAAVPLDREAARDLLGRVRVSKLLADFRGRGAMDEAALIDAIVALGRLAHERRESLQSLDINPLVVLPAGRDVVALDALVVVREYAPATDNKP